MAQKRLKIIKESDNSAWLTSFTDLIMLILTFFVMIYATRDHEENKWLGVVDSFDSFLQGRKIVRVFDAEPEKGELKEANLRLQNITYFKNFIKYKLDQLGFEKQKLQYFIGDDYLKLSFYFNQLDDDELYKVLKILKDLLDYTKNYVEVEYFEYSNVTAYNNSVKIINLFKQLGLEKKVFIKLNEDILLPEKADINKKIGKLSFIIYENEEI